MTKSSSSIINKELTALPIARIETMDVSYVLPLREYLFTNGCQVFVNTGPTENVTYFFIVGDSNFVKKTLAFRHDLGKKQLIICWDTEEDESINQFFHPHTKIVYVDPTPLTPGHITEIFTFLFTTKGRECVLGKTKKSNQPLGNRPIPVLPLHIDTEDLHSPSSSEVYECIQKKQISHAINDTFGNQTKKSMSSAHRRFHINSMLKIQKKYRLPFIGGLILMLIIFPFLLYIGSLGMRGWSIMQAAQCLQTGNARCVKTHVNNQRVWKSFMDIAAQPVYTLHHIFLQDKTVQAYERVDRLMTVIVDLEEELLVINGVAQSLSSSFFFNQKEPSSVPPVVATDAIKKNIPSIKSKLDLASGYLESLNTESSFFFSHALIQKYMQKAMKKMDTFRQIAEMGERLTQLYPFIGGFRDKEHILILLQNSSELRPTGGFIGSLAHITLSEGTIEDMRIEDVYALDGQLKGHVDPPIPIRDLLAQEHWYLRDSNWNPDFAKTAQQVQFFYEKETGKQVQTIIGLTSSFIVNILKVIGPVEIPLYNDRITADNFYLKSFYYTQANFFPGSSQKKDFLGSLMEAILSKLQTTPQATLALMEILYNSILSRDIQWYTSNNDGQQIIERFGWGGNAPAQSTCLSISQSPCVFSYTYLNEANVGVNKVNAFITRTQMHSVVIDDNGSITQTITRKLQNRSQGESGAGTYLTYLRIFVPEQAKITTITLDGASVPMKNEKAKHNTHPYGELDTSLFGVMGIGIAFDVLPGTERVISLSYTISNTTLKEGKEGILTLFDQKQPGVDNIPTTTTITYPPAWEAQSISSSPMRMVAKQGYLEYNTMVSEDTDITIRFLK